MSFAILRVEKLKGSAVSSSDMHLDRKRETLNADGKRTGQNIYLIGARGESLRTTVDTHIKAAGGKPRKDSVECVEFLMTASPEYFSSPTKTTDFVRQSKKFMDRLEDRGMKFVKVCVHLDESTPHISAFAVPFDSSGKLNAKAHLGGREKLSGLQDEFAQMMEPLGLERGIKGSVAEHQKIQTYYGKLNLLDESQEQVRQLQADQDRAREMLQRSNEILSTEQQKRIDITLREAASLLQNNVIETSQGLAILKQNDPAKLLAVITPDNKAFNSEGEKISDGSSVMMISRIADVTPEAALSMIEDSYDKDTSARAGRAFGEELANKALIDYEEKRDVSNAEAEVRDETESQEQEAIEIHDAVEMEALVLS
jgi:hypothetical protein